MEINWKSPSFGKDEVEAHPVPEHLQPLQQALVGQKPGEPKAAVPWFQSLFAVATSPGERAKSVAPSSVGKPGQGVPIPKGTSFGKVTPLGQSGNPLAMGRLQQAKDTSGIAEIQGALRKEETPRGEAAFQSSQRGILHVEEPERPGPCGGSRENPQDALPGGNVATPNHPCAFLIQRAPRFFLKPLVAQPSYAESAPSSTPTPPLEARPTAHLPYP